MNDAAIMKPGKLPPIILAQQNETNPATIEARSSVSEIALSPENEATKAKTSAKDLWKQAGKKIKLAQVVAGGFKTLRDQYGVNEVEQSELKFIKKLGEGAFATVEKCVYTPKLSEEEASPKTPQSPMASDCPSSPKPVMREVAVKKLKPEVVKNESDMDSFMAEVALMRKLKHHNIVEYIGIGSSDLSSEEKRRSSMFMVSELVEGGTIKRLVMNQMMTPAASLYKTRDAVRWCHNIAEALAYLHSVKPQIIHRDLKLENILLTSIGISSDRSKQEAKLADFGLVAFVQKGKEKDKGVGHELSTGQLQLNREASVAALDEAVRNLQYQRSSRRNRDIARTDSKVSESSAASLPIKGLLTGQTGTLMYMAPEMYRNEQYDEKVDVFSFAICMYEVLHKYMMVFAVSNKGTEEEIEAYAAQVSDGFRPSIMESLQPDLRSIIQDAWQGDPKKRPSMAEIAKRLQEALEGGIEEVGQQPMCGCSVM